MSDQQFDFTPYDDNETEQSFFCDEITEEDMWRANEALKDCPEPDYASMIPPEEEGVFTVDDGIYLPPESAIPLKFDKCTEAIQKAIDAVLETYQDQVEINGIDELIIPASLGGIIQRMIWNSIRKRYQSSEPSSYVPSTYELEEEFGPMDEDDIPTFRAIYSGDDDTVAVDDEVFNHPDANEKARITLTYTYEDDLSLPF